MAFWKRQRQKKNKFDEKRSRVWDETRQRVADRMLYGSEAPVERLVSGAAPTDEPSPETDISSVREAAVGSTPDGPITPAERARGYMQRAADYRAAATEWRRRGVERERVQRFEEMANRLEDQALRLTRAKLVEADRAKAIAPNAIVRIDGDSLTLANGQRIMKPAGSPAWGYQIGDEIQGMPTPPLDRPLVMIGNIPIDAGVGAEALLKETLDKARDEQFLSASREQEQYWKNFLYMAGQQWIKVPKSGVIENLEVTSGLAAQKLEEQAEYWKTPAVSREDGAFPSAGRQSYVRDPKTGEISRGGRSNAVDEATRYTLADPEMPAAEVIAWLRKMGSPWSGTEQVFGNNSAREAWRTWRRGDRFALATGWHRNDRAIFSSLQRLFGEGYREIARADVQVWEAPPLEPMDLSLGPLSLNVDPRTLCGQCGKPAFTHRYQNDNTDIYGQRGEWTCLGESVVIPKKDLGRSRIVLSGPEIAASRDQQGVFTRAMQEELNRRQLEALGVYGAVLGAKPESAPAEKKPELLKRVARSYDDDF